MKTLVQGIFFSAFVTSIAIGGTDAADVVLNVPSAAGEPEYPVVVEFRGALSQPVIAFEIHFRISQNVADFLRTEVYDTVSSQVVAAGIIHDTNRVTEEFATGVRLDLQNPPGQIGPGENLLLVKAALLILPHTPPQELAIMVLSAKFTGQNGQDLSTKIENVGVLTVFPRSRPSPVRAFRCSQRGETVLLTWRNSELYDSLYLISDKGLSAILDGTDTSFLDHPPVGSVKYCLWARWHKNGDVKYSPIANCSLKVRPLLVPEIKNLSCSSDEEGNHLRWENGAAYDSIQLLRNDRKIALLPGSSQSFDDPIRSDILIIYTLRASAGGLEALPANCRVNDFGPEFKYWSEEVRAKPGDRRVAVRVFATNSDMVDGMQIGLRMDPSLVTIRDLSVDQTATGAVGYSHFLYQTHTLDIGETLAGFVFINHVSKHERQFPPGRDQHVLTIHVDIKPDAHQGAVVPVQFGFFGDPRNGCTFTINGYREVAETCSGAVLVGDSPIPAVENLVAEANEEDVSAAGGGVEAGQAVALSWMNKASYSSIRIERDAAEVAIIPGESTGFIDQDAGLGTHRYRVIPRLGDQQAFPAVAMVLPHGAQRPFLRGDSNSDNRVDIWDAHAILAALFLGDRKLSCPDAADADDSCHLDLSDPVFLLQNLFQGGQPLPAPGPQMPWFDPTPDELPCR